MNAPARQVLKELVQAKASEWVLPSTSVAKRALSKGTIEAAWQRIRSAAQLDDVRLHDLRHTVGTYAGQSGANSFLVRDLLHHENLSMTGRYVNRSDDPVRTLSDQVGERIAAGLAGRKGGGWWSSNEGSGGYAQTAAGTLTSFGANTLRYTTLGLLAEESRQNVVLVSNGGVGRTVGNNKCHSQSKCGVDT
jgi:hypothetical protein